jgi:HPt (histidine-containing phosphotransfer) domain-containing protein
MAAARPASGDARPESQSAASVPEPPAFDAVLERALRHTGGDRELLGQMAGIFLDTLPSMVDQLRRAVAQRQTATVRRLAHSLKGSCGYFAVDDAWNVAFALEQTPDDDDVVRKLAVLEDELTRAAPTIGLLANRGPLPPLPFARRANGPGSHV